MAARTPLLVLLLLLLGGCRSASSLAEDHTALRGQVPSGLGRILEVELEGFAPAAGHEVLGALTRELEAADLFDIVLPAPGSDRPAPARSASRLRVTQVELVSEGLYDFWRLHHVHVVRHELDIRLLDARGEAVLEGRVTGVAMDPETEPEFITGESDEARAKREDVRLAALQDAVSKMSRALRDAAHTRARAALDALEEVRLPPGVGPVEVAVLGFDDEPTARRRRGAVLAAYLTEALTRLGPAVAPASRTEVDRALDRVLPPGGERVVAGIGGAGFVEMRPHHFEKLTQHLRPPLFVVGRLTLAGGRVSAEAHLLDRAQARLRTLRVEAEGLGALRVVAAELAREVGRALPELPLGP